MEFLYFNFLLSMYDTCNTGGTCYKGKQVILLVLGILFFLGSLGIWPEFTFTRYWPLVIILFALYKLFCPCGKKEQ